MFRLRLQFNNQVGTQFFAGGKKLRGTRMEVNRLLAQIIGYVGHGFRLPPAHRPVGQQLAAADQLGFQQRQSVTCRLSFWRGECGYVENRAGVDLVHD